MAATSTELPNSTGENMMDLIGGEEALKSTLRDIYGEGVFDQILVSNSKEWSTHVGTCIFQLNQASQVPFKRHNIFFVCD